MVWLLLMGFFLLTLVLIVATDARGTGADILSIACIVVVLASGAAFFIRMVMVSCWI